MNRRFTIPPCDPQLAPPTDIDVPFEGVEKRLVVSVKAGLPWRPFDFTKSEWQSILDYAHCEIVSERHLADTSVYLLSESTLTVWPSGFLLKTCGRTTPFLVLDVLSKYVYPEEPLVNIIDWMIYSRLDFLHPQFQVWPHQSHAQEADYLLNLVPGTQPFHLPAGQHALVGFVYGSSSPSTATKPMQLEEALMMQVDRHCVRAFSGFDTPQEQTSEDDGSSHHGFLRPTLSATSAANELDEFWFSPFGYSSNALATGLSDQNQHAAYFSCHVSPEPETSYASLEVGGYGNNNSALIPIAKLVPAFNAKYVHITKVCVRSKICGGEGDLMETQLQASSGYYLTESSSVTIGHISVHHLLMERPGGNYLSLADLPALTFTHNTKDRSSQHHQDQITNALTTASGDELSDKVNSQD